MNMQLYMEASSKVEHDKMTSCVIGWVVIPQTVDTPTKCFALSCYSQVTADGAVVIVDEVGKMELFSQSFISSVRELFSLEQATILASVPLTKQRPISFVDELKKRKDVTLIEVRCL